MNVFGLSLPAAADDDQALVSRIGEGDIHAFETAYDLYSSQLFSLAMRVTGRRRAAEEATQDAFLALWRSPGRFDVDRGTLRNWLLTMVRNRSIDWIRRERRHDRGIEFDGSFADRLEAAERTDDQVFASDQARRTRGLVSGLPAEQRQVIELAFYSGLTQTEIAALLRIPLGTVKGRQRLAMAKMRLALAGAGSSADQLRAAAHAPA